MAHNDSGEASTAHPFNTSQTRKRRAADDSAGPSKKHQSSGKQTDTSGFSLDLALDILCSLLLGKTDHPLYDRNVKHAVECATDHEQLEDALETPLQRLIDAAKEKFTSVDKEAEKSLMRALIRRYAEHVMQTLALAVGDALSCTSDTEAMSVTTSTGEFKAELRIAPVFGIEEPGSVEQEQGDQQLENSAAKPEAHTSTTREGNSGRAVADQQDGRSTHDCEAQGRQDQVSSAANDGEAHDSGEGGEQASPIILQAFSEVSQFQVQRRRARQLPGCACTTAQFGFGASPGRCFTKNERLRDRRARWTGGSTRLQRWRH